MKCVALLLVLANFSGPALAGNPAPSPVADQAQRKDAKAGWTEIEEFPHVEIVKEGTTEYDPTLVAVIEDPGLRELIKAGAFQSLQVRNLSIRAGDVRVVGSKLTVPYGATVKQSLGPVRNTNFNQKSIDVDGELSIEYDGTQLKVTVERFANTSWLEDIGDWLGYNKHVDLAFARAIAPPVIEWWFAQDPARTQNLLGLIRARGTAKP